MLSEHDIRDLDIAEWRKLTERKRKYWLVRVRAFKKVLLEGRSIGGLRMSAEQELMLTCLETTR